MYRVLICTTKRVCPTCLSIGHEARIEAVESRRNGILSVLVVDVPLRARSLECVDKVKGADPKPRNVEYNLARRGGQDPRLITSSSSGLRTVDLVVGRPALLGAIKKTSAQSKHEPAQAKNQPLRRICLVCSCCGKTLFTDALLYCKLVQSMHHPWLVLHPKP
jgi:hypothetical protein